jgi:hypothetical protein
VGTLVILAFPKTERSFKTCIKLILLGFAASKEFPEKGSFSGDISFDHSFPGQRWRVLIFLTPLSELL